MGHMFTMLVRYLSVLISSHIKLDNRIRTGIGPLDER